jgi:hypothetical protein
MRLINSRKFRSVFATAAFIFLSSAAAGVVPAQSSDVNYPAPVFSKVVEGRIAPRDVGDPRRTRHFYTFRGTEGDLTITLDTSELVGDVDVFTATTLRPLLKFTLLGDAAHLTKSFYIRSEETFVLRVEARAVGDAEGSYRIQFGGSFEPAPADLANASPPAEPTVSGRESRGGNVRRVTSTGARIAEPKPEPTPAEEATREPEAKPSPTPAEAAPERRQPTPPRRTAGTRAATGRARAGTARTRPAAKPPAPETSETKPAAETTTPAEPKTETKAEASTEPATPAASTSRTATPPRRRGTRAPARAARGESARTGEPSAAQPSSSGPPAGEPPAPSQRLVIVTKDGQMIERDMNSVRRVTVEGNLLIVITKDGKIIRQPMTNVERMAIEP